MSDYDDYREGFRQGYKSVKGNNVAVPAIPAKPATPAGMTAFQLGIKKGIEAANR